MRFSLQHPSNPYTFNNAFLGGYITGKVEGLGPLPIRSSKGSYAGRSGGYHGRPLWDPRLITITGTLVANTAAEMQERRILFADAAARLDDFELIILGDDGHRYLIFCVMDGTPTLDHIPLDPLKAPFSISMIADDPVIYDDTSIGQQVVALQKVVGGGVAWPVTWPLTWAPGATGTTVTNDGYVPIYPVITLTGSMTNPVIQNETTGEFISLSGFTAPAGSVVKVDLYNQAVTLNGGNITGMRDDTSTWWPLELGPNTIKLSTSDIADTVVGEVVWRNGLLGI